MPRYLVSNRIAQLLCVAALLWLFGTSPTERSSTCAHAREAAVHAHDHEQLQPGELRGRSRVRPEGSGAASDIEAVADQRVLIELITALDRARRDHQDPHRARR
jgi:hypothetical protein